MRSLAILCFLGGVAAAQPLPSGPSQPLPPAAALPSPAPLPPTGPLTAPLVEKAPLLTLDDAVRLARARHPSVLQQRAALEIARARLKQAWSSLLPGLTGNVTYNPQTANFAPTPGFQRVLARPPTTGTTPVGGNQLVCELAGSTSCAPMAATPSLPADYSLFNYWSMGVGINWTLWDWGRTLYNVRASDEVVDAQKLTVEASLQQVTLDVKLAYYNAIAAEASVRVSDEAVQTQARHLEQAQAFYQVGTRTKIDVASAESDLANAELTLARAHGALEAAQAQLAAALGDERWQAYRLQAPPEYDAAMRAPSAAAPPLDQSTNEALARRPEPRDLALRARSFTDLARSQRGQLLPFLQLALGPSWAGTDLTGLATNFQVTLSLTFPLLGMNPVLVWGQMKEAEGNRALVDAQAMAARNGIRLETAQAHAALASAHEEVAAAHKLVLAAHERQQLAEGRYQAGVGSIIELSDAELAYVNAEFQAVQAALDLASAEARLDHALGRL